MSKKEEAASRMGNGYNCAQAVFCTFAKDLGIDETQAFKMSEGFGGGMAGMQQTCGAVVAAYMAAGLKKSDGAIDGHSKSKKDTYAVVRKIAEEFEAKNTTTICRELKGIGTGKILRSCTGCVEDAAEIAEKVFNEIDAN